MTTPKELELLDVITSHVHSNGYPPTYAQMMTALGLKSKSGIFRMVTSLERQGIIQRSGGRRHHALIVRNKVTPEMAMAGAQAMFDPRSQTVSLTQLATLVYEAMEAKRKAPG